MGSHQHLCPCHVQSGMGVSWRSVTIKSHQCDRLVISVPRTCCHGTTPKIPDPRKPRDSTPSSHFRLGFPRQPLYFSKKLFPLYPSCVLFLTWQIQMRWSYGDLVLHFGKHPSHNALQEDGQNYLTQPWQQHRRQSQLCLSQQWWWAYIQTSSKAIRSNIYYNKYNIYTHIYYWEYVLYIETYVHIHYTYTSYVSIYCYVTKTNATMKVEERETHDLIVTFLSDHKVH